MIRKAALTCLMIAIVVTASACGTGHPAPKPAAESGLELNADFSGSGPGTLSAANTLPTIDRRLRAVTSIAARVTYMSTSGITDGHTQVTGTVFAPKGTPPPGGWPIVALGHPTSGTLPECAPSLSPTLVNMSGLVTSLVKAGYVVTVPDYQGLGLDKTYHPYLDSTTAGYNVIDAVRAVRKVVPDTSNRWLAMGSSQGGQAVWAANELAANYGGGLTLLGAVSVSPPANINGFADGVEAGTLTKDQQPVWQWLLAALKNEYPDLNLDDYRRGIVQDKWNILLQCQGPALDERTKVVDQITANDLRPSTPQALAALRGYLQKTSLPQGPTLAPMLVLYGGKDALIPRAWTERALDQACRMGDVIQIQPQPDKGHDEIDPTTAFSWVTDRFNGVPAPNGCESFLAAIATSGGSPGEGG
jgi:alpha-beta hydrolase superfamily lysophospholipase